MFPLSNLNLKKKNISFCLLEPPFNSLSKFVKPGGFFLVFLATLCILNLSDIVKMAKKINWTELNWSSRGTWLKSCDSVRHSFHVCLWMLHWVKRWKLSTSCGCFKRWLSFLSFIIQSGWKLICDRKIVTWHVHVNYIWCIWTNHDLSNIWMFLCPFFSGAVKHLWKTLILWYVLDAWCKISLW